MTTGGELHVTALTHRGAVRQTNEDALVMGALTACVDTPHPVRVLIPTGEPVILAVADMEKILAAHTNDEAAVHALWQAAMAAGGKDNISILLARS